MKNLAGLFAALTLLTLQAHAVVMELRGQLTMIGGTLTLNDLLSSSQGLSADDLRAPIADAPSLGNSQTWTRDDIAKRLPMTLKAEKLEWTGATECKVDRPAAQCTEHDVRALITAELGQRLPPDSDFAILETPNCDPFPIPQGPARDAR